MKENKIHKLFQRVLLLMAFCTLSFTVVNAQSTVSGVIKDSDGEPVVGANVIIDGTTTGTTTDFDGNYTIQVPSDDAVLVFSMMGMATEKVRAGDVTDAPMVLLPDLVGLDEVVVVGYGTMKKSDITGSVSSIGSDDILAAPIVSLDAGLQGKMAGVTLQQNSGAPGEAMRVRIRGGGSINFSNSPLYVIDGYVGGDMNSVSPQDIERIDVLKDASATAIYGSRGANGVVIITTKTAKAGEFKISLDATYGISKQIKDVDMLDAATSAELYNMRELASGNPAYFTQADVDSFRLAGSNNHVNDITRTAKTQNYNLSMSGGSDKLTYLFSAGYIDEQGVLLESFRKRYSIRSNIKAEIKPWLEMKFNTFGSHDNSMHNDRSQRAIMDAYMFPVFWPTKNSDGTYVKTSDQNYYNATQILRTDMRNPIQTNEYSANGEKLNEGVTSSLDLTFKITDHLSLVTRGAGNYYSYYEGYMPYADGVVVASEDVIGSRQRHDRRRNLMTTGILKYENSFGLHDVSVSGIYEYSNDQYRKTNVSVQNLSTTANQWYVLSNGVNPTVSSDYWIRMLQSYMGRANYSYADKYMLTGTVRIDESSVFRSENRRGIFSSFAGGWTLSKEDFLSNVTWIHNLKIRGGWGQTGNQAIGPYSTNPSMLGLGDWGDGWGFPGSYPFNGTVSGIVNGIIPDSKFTDTSIKWETSVQTNFGIDFSIFEGKVNMVADFYQKKTTDAIISKSVADYTGKEQLTDNFGQVNNTGFEFMTDWNAIERADFRMNIGGNISMNRCKVVDLDGLDELFFVDNLAGIGMWTVDDNNPFIVKEGRSLGLFYGIKDNGLWQVGQVDKNGRSAADFGSNPGEPMYEDLNDDGVIDANDRQIIGEVAPDFNYGITLNLSYKDFTMTINGVGSYGGELYNYTRQYMDNNMLNPDYSDMWSPQNTGATQSVPVAGTNPAASFITSRYIEDATYFKINNLTVGYNLPQSLLKKVKINSFNVFASVNNLLTITKYSGINPEVSVTDVNSDSHSGLDSFGYPLARTFTFGFKTNF